MKSRAICANLLAVIAVVGVMLMPATASAQSWLEREYHRRQQMKNEWRNIALGAGVLAVIGLLKDDKTLFFSGTAGALYSAWRYEQDRKSQSKLARARAAYFSKPYFYRDGKRYVRKTVWKNGKKY